MPADQDAVSPPGLYAAFRDAGRPVLRESSVFLLDLLGTSAGTQHDADIALETTHRAMLRARRWSEQLPDRILVRWFSDNAVVAAPLDDNRYIGELNCAATIVTIAAIQLEFAMQGFFLRGGGQLGEFYADSDFVYGPALVKAHHIENHVAVYPRVILASPLVAHIKRHWNELDEAFPAEIYRDVLAVDHDGAVFVDYLAMTGDLSDDEEAWLSNHREHIRARLAAHAGDDRICTKYHWAANYHDRYCRWRFADTKGLDHLFFDSNESLRLRSFTRS